MKRSLGILLFFILINQSFAQSTPLIAIQTQKSELVYIVDKNQKVLQVYLGERLKENSELTKARIQQHEMYVPFGTGDFFESAIRATHNDGNPSIELKYVKNEVKKLDDNVTETIIYLKDMQYPFEVKMHFKAYFREDVIEQWTEITHQEKEPIILSLFSSSMLHFDAKEYWLTQFHGDWAKEMRMEESRLTSGIKVIDSKLGTRADLHQTPFFMLSLNKLADENSGEVLAGTLAWTGNFKFSFELDNNNSLRVISGINPYASEYRLIPGKVFTTPSFVFTYSKSGKELTSQNLQRWSRKYSLLDGDQPRMTLLNNWETTFFDFNEEKLKGMISDTKKLGVDLFLLDDGWFANKYPRNNDKSSLGDWEPNKTKLPNGIGVLVKEAEKQGVKFGIWIEPEMVNPKSELYEKHPDWIIRLPNRPEDYSRNQLVLDLPNPKVQDFVFGVLDNLMTQNPGIAYIKWDCNRPMTSSYSPYLKDNQSAIYIDYVQAWYNVLDRVRAKYPHLPIMLCSGGGGRIDYRGLKYFTEFWASDNTDPLERVYIQWGYSYYMPAIATCNHITSWGKQSIKFRTDVAMMGKMGYDIQLAHLNEKELKFSQDAIVNYKKISDIIWYGNLYRLASPYEGNRAVVQFSNEAKTRAVLFSYNLNTRYREAFNLVKLRGLDEAKNYKIEEINLFPDTKSRFQFQGKTFSGDYLMKMGLNVSGSEALSSYVLEITQI
ncbi:MAG TPA: alpha-galactosidase [Prolixibacteraceae bacterium]